MVNKELAYKELQHSTKKPYKEVKRVVDSICRINKDISYTRLISLASKNLQEDPAETVKQLDEALSMLGQKLRRQW